MSASNASAKHRQQNLMRLQRRMKSLRNEMEFVEILAQFWPLGNMHARMERLETQMKALSREMEVQRKLMQAVG